MCFRIATISEKYSDRKRTAEAAEGFDRLVQDGMARKFDAVVVDSIFRCGRTLPFAIEALQRTFYPLGIGKIFSNLCGNAAGGEVSNKSFAHDKCTSFD